MDFAIIAKRYCIKYTYLTYIPVCKRIDSENLQLFFLHAPDTLVAPLQQIFTALFFFLELQDDVLRLSYRSLHFDQL